MVRPPLGSRGAGAERRGAAPADADTPDAVLVLRTLGAPRRHRFRGRRGSEVEEIEPTPVPIARVTVVRPEPFADAAAADRWLDTLRGDAEAAHAAVDAAVAVVNRAVQAYRIAAPDAYTTPASATRALVTRIGYGDGAAVADGEATRAWELPPGGRRKRLRSMEAPDERFAAILGGRREALACEELVLRATADLRAGRDREAALETRIALEAMIAELGEWDVPGEPPPADAPSDAAPGEPPSPAGTPPNAALDEPPPGGTLPNAAPDDPPLPAGTFPDAASHEPPPPAGTLADARRTVADAASAALRGPLDEPLRERLEAVVDAMERRLRNRRLTT